MKPGSAPADLPKALSVKISENESALARKVSSIARRRWFDT
jgi:hypothetical protein